ncbi:nitroreductase family protein [Methanobacterium spitsbergense]|uniref:Nitroreductase family protein n=1 Tax=Methanobacterium spitsbergense TaxID=2874285 RepID=A0A8T5UWK6_9EURY|nr:nitroreductase family protein [Methanobacterium spitsbergense]MBZ2166677.1 nitroreductase family protein [Methanobacterium spitsbergense]
MDVNKAIEVRRSIRKYKKIDIEEDKLDKILESARIAPSAANRQQWKFVVVKDPNIRKKLVDACHGQVFVGEAPVVIAACSTESDQKMPCGQYAYTVDLSIALSFMILQATELELGTCWLGAFNEDNVKNILNIPDNIRVVGVITIGYPDEKPDPRPRKTMGEIVSNNGWM